MARDLGAGSFRRVADFVPGDLGGRLGFLQLVEGYTRVTVDAAIPCMPGSKRGCTGCNQTSGVQTPNPSLRAWSRKLGYTRVKEK